MREIQFNRYTSGLPQDSVTARPISGLKPDVRSVALIFAILLSAVGCGNGNSSPERLDDVLALEYQGRALRQILLQEPHARYVSEVCIAFRSVLGTHGGKWLGTAVAAGLPSSDRWAFFLLDADLEAAQEGAERLQSWLRDDVQRDLQLVSARLSIEVGIRSDLAIRIMSQALLSEDSNVAFSAIQEAARLGPRVDVFAETILKRVEEWHANERAYPTMEAMFADETRKHVFTSELLQLLRQAGGGADFIVPRLAALLTLPRDDKTEVIATIASRGVAAETAIPDLVALSSSGDAAIRCAVAKALGTIGRQLPASQDCRRALDRLLRDVEADVRAAASDALAQLDQA